MREIHTGKVHSLEADSFMNAFVTFPRRLHVGRTTALISLEGKRNCARQCGAGMMIVRKNRIFCRKRSSGSLIARQFPIWVGYGR